MSEHIYHDSVVFSSRIFECRVFRKFDLTFSFLNTHIRNTMILRFSARLFYFGIVDLLQVYFFTNVDLFIQDVCRTMHSFYVYMHSCMYVCMYVYERVHCEGVCIPLKGLG